MLNKIVYIKKARVLRESIILQVLALLMQASEVVSTVGHTVMTLQS